MACYSPKKDNIHVAVDNDEFCCPLCCELFQEPKLLPSCAHNFCKSCLVELVKRSGREISCPVCRVKSRIPPNGAVGFATNSLLVRLIDNIRKEKEEQENSALFTIIKEEVNRKNKMLDEMVAKCTMIARNRELAEELKTEISTYANEHVEAIKKYQKDLCEEVDAFSMQNCGVSSLEKLEEEKRKLERPVVAMKAIEFEDIGLEQQNTMKSLLAEFIETPTSSILEELGEVKEFDMKFSRCEINMESGLGKVFSKQLHSKESGTASVQQNSHTPQKENKEAAAYRDFLKASGITNCNLYEGTVIQHIPLQFEPFAVAVSPSNGNIALLWEEMRQIYLFTAEGHYFNTISITYGDLWDVAYSIDNDIIVVNRANNQLLFYTESGQFINRQVEVPRTCLKFTYLSVDEMGRLIVTSTRVNNGDDDEIHVVQCLIVYQFRSTTSNRMFGRKHLQRPVSRAIFFKEQYYVADCCSQEIVLKVFNVQGKFVSQISYIPTALTTSSISISRDPFSDRFITCYSNSSSKDFLEIVGRGASESNKLFCPHGFPIQVEAHSDSDEGKSTCFVEIYDDKKCYNIVKYPL